MPLTFLAHQVPVLPLKLRWPTIFDGTALVIGSMAPDLLFVLRGSDLAVDAHAVPTQLWLVAPLTVLLTILTKRVIAGVLGPHLPDAGRFRLRDYGRLSAWTVPRTPQMWAVLVISALIGCYSHLVLDSFTHNWGYAAGLLGITGVEVFSLSLGIASRTIFLVDLLQLGGSIVGVAIALILLRTIGDRRLLASSYPTADRLEPTRESRRTLWFVTAAVTLVGLATGAIPALNGGQHDVLFRSVDSAFAGLLLGAALARSKMTRAPVVVESSSELASVGR